MTVEEKNLNLNLFDKHAPEGQEEVYWKRKDLRFPNKMDVISIAQAWSVNPLQIENMYLPESVGLVGEFLGPTKR